MTGGRADWRASRNDTMAGSEPDQAGNTPALESRGACGQGPGRSIEPLGTFDQQQADHPERRAWERRPPPFAHTRNGRAVVLGLAAATMAIEMISLLASSRITIGSFRLSLSLVPAVVLLGVLGPRSVGRARDRDRLVPFWIAMAAGLGLGVTVFGRTGDLVDVAALLAAAVDEEVVFRFAVPVVVTTALMLLRLPATASRRVGYVVGGVWWVLLPGHQAQTDGPVQLVTYIAFAVIAAVVVARSRALIPMSIAHCVLNIITLAAERGEITDGARGVLSGCLLFLLIGTFAWPGDMRRRAADDEDLVTDTIIDLRDGEVPSIMRDGRRVPIDDQPVGNHHGAVDQPVGAPVSRTDDDPR